MNALTINLLNRLELYDINYPQTEKLLGYLLSERGEYKKLDTLPEWNWHYRLEGVKKRNNDLIHLMFIVGALLDHPETKQLGKEILVKAHPYYFDEQGLPRDTTETMGSLNWGPSAYLFYAACQKELENETKKLAHHIAQKVQNEDLSQSQDNQNLRRLSWYALALLKYDSCR